MSSECYELFQLSVLWLRNTLSSLESHVPARYKAIIGARYDDLMSLRRIVAGAKSVKAPASKEAR